ncbi:MAG: hypothetical protein ACRDZX_02700 [Acidimicrobiales bacterium]
MVELPEVRPVVTEHRAHRRRCRCGHVSAGVFPEDVRVAISYGPRVKAVVAYLLARQHHARIAALQGQLAYALKHGEVAAVKTVLRELVASIEVHNHRLVRPNFRVPSAV